MNTIKVCFTVFLFLLIINLSSSNDLSASKSNSNFFNSKVIGEGTVHYIIPSFTPEISNHVGYILINQKWKIPPVEERSYTFLEPDSLIKIYHDKRVHIEGLQFKIPGKKIDDHTYMNPYDVIIVDKIYCID